MKGVIFDFNGTMFLDSHLHEQAWFHMVRKYAAGSITDEEIFTNIHGRTNNEILRHFVSHELSADDIRKLSDEKEGLYRELCLQNEKDLVLTNGLTGILDHLKAQNLPRTIATATVKENVAFYFDVFKLDRWFDFETVTFDDGSFPGKPAPDIFLIAAKKLGLQPSECLVIEDAFSGLTAAKKAGIGKIIAIDPFGKNREAFLQNQLGSDGIIQDFTNFHDILITEPLI
ncbi:HAD family phosphatase [Terribacillus sp. 179-K 1B1 HS]|uniref:HAD family hydrolase n=1 Tax=Terribacillus sp. 179-K 1B1 HS TaxID=3142388 RepID=UPI0039A0DDD1